MASNLTNQVRTIASVTRAVAEGDLSQTVDVDVQGEMLALKNTVNSMVQQVYIEINCAEPRVTPYCSYKYLLERSAESHWKSGLSAILVPKRK
jgi:hypothetical protein